MAPGRFGNATLTCRGDLLGRQGAITRPEPEGEGQGPMAFGHLRSGVHIEEPHVLAQLPRTRAHGLGHVGGRHRVGDHERDVLLGHWLRADIRRGSHVMRRIHERVEVQLECTGTGRE